MAAAAAATSSLRVGTLVFDNDYKHPVVLAKEIATIDTLFEGRVEFGLGSGWMRSDYDESGISYDPPGVRVERFMEAISIIKGLWSEDPVNHTGEHYTITNLNGLPKPHNPGGPPLLIGAGAPRMLRFAGEHADIVGVNPSIHSGSIDAAAARDAGADRFDQKVAWVKQGAGARFDDIELNVLVFMVMVTDDRDSAAANIAPMFGLDAETVLASPALMIGSVDQICDDLQRQRERWGVSYYVVQGEAMHTLAPVVERLNGA